MVTGHTRGLLHHSARRCDSARVVPTVGQGESACTTAATSLSAARLTLDPCEVRSGRY